MKLKITVVSIAVGVGIAAGAITVAVWHSDRPIRLSKRLEKLREEWQRAYFEGTFQEATNALNRFIRFVEAHRQQFPSYKDVDDNLYSAYAYLSYMLMCTPDVTGAANSIDKPYYHWKRIRARYLQEPVPKSEFVDFIVTGAEKVIMRRGAHWRSDFSPDTNTVKGVKEQLGAQPGRTVDGR